MKKNARTFLESLYREPGPAAEPSGSPEVLDCGTVDASIVDGTPTGDIETEGIVDVNTVDTRNTASLITVDDREMLTPSRLEWAKQ